MENNEKRNLSAIFVILFVICFIMAIFIEDTGGTVVFLLISLFCAILAIVSDIDC